MGVWIGLFVTITLALLGLIKKKSKSLLFLQWSWIWLIQGFNRGGMDYHMNEFIYNNGGNPVEWLTYGIIKSFRQMGLDYMWYRLMWMTIGVIILYKIVKSYSQYPCLVMFPYVFFMLADNVAQCRFFWAYSMVLFSYHWYLQKRRIATIIILIIATGVHPSAFVFLILPFIYRFTKREFIVKNTIIICVGLLLLRYASFLLNGVGLSYAADKLNAYINNDNYSSVMVGAIFLCLYATLIAVSIYRIERHRSKNKFELYSLTLNKGSIFMLPMLLINSNFGRFFRPIIFTDFVGLSNIRKSGWLYSESSNYTKAIYALAFLAGIVLQSRANFFAIDTLFYNNYLLMLLS